MLLNSNHLLLRICQFPISIKGLLLHGVGMLLHGVSMLLHATEKWFSWTKKFKYFYYPTSAASGVIEIRKLFLKFLLLGGIIRWIFYLKDWVSSLLCIYYVGKTWRWRRLIHFAMNFWRFHRDIIKFIKFKMYCIRELVNRSFRFNIIDFADAQSIISKLKLPFTNTWYSTFWMQ